jgi:hypothetical protein
LLGEGEAGGFDGDYVIAYRYWIEGEFSILVALCRAREIGSCRLQFHIRVGDGPVLRVVNNSSDTAKDGRARGWYTREQSNCKAIHHTLPHWEASRFKFFVR